MLVIFARIDELRGSTSIFSEQTQFVYAFKDWSVDCLENSKVRIWYCNDCGDEPYPLFFKNLIKDYLSNLTGIMVTVKIAHDKEAPQRCI